MAEMADENQRPGPPETCGCFAAPYANLGGAGELGMDAGFAEVSVLACRECGQHWLRYFYEVEAFHRLGAVVSRRHHAGGVTRPEYGER